jgi:uncharacterized protein (DUF697 family)
MPAFDRVDVSEFVVRISYMAIPFFRRNDPRTDVVVTQASRAQVGLDSLDSTDSSARKVVDMKDAPARGGPKLCRHKARAMIHKYAAFGTAWAVLPIPIATSAGLTALETHMLYWIARAYGEEPSKSDVVMAAGGLELCSVALKTAAIEGANLVPVVGWGVKAAIAGSAIEAIGQAAIMHYESKYPGKAA